MTPLGEKLRAMREERHIALKDMARAIGVSPAYLSAMEHGHRSKPTYIMLQRIIGYFNVIWDEADELQKLADISDPNVSVKTAGLSPTATQLANLLARDIEKLKEADLQFLATQVQDRAASK